MLTRMTIDEMNALSAGTLMEHLGIVYTEIGPDYLCGTMPVDNRTKQPAGLLHGGASAALAETLGSMGSMSIVDLQKQYIVGIEINANHLRKVSEGKVHGKATLIARSRKLHIWEIKIHNDAGALVCLARHTIMVLEKQVNE